MGLVSEETLKEVNLKYSDEDLKAREEIIAQSKEKLLSYNLKWTYRSISYLVSKEKITLNNLRNFIFTTSTGAVEVNLERAVHLLITIGLIGAGKFEEKDWETISDEAYGIMDDWSESYHIAVLHCLIIDLMTKKHFFMAGQDTLAMDAMSLLSIEKSLAIRHLAISEETKLQQMYNYGQI